MSLDGDEDLFCGKWLRVSGSKCRTEFLFPKYPHSGGSAFVDASAELGLDEMAISVEAIDWDYDNDGDVDLFVTNSNTFSLLL